MSDDILCDIYHIFRPQLNKSRMPDALEHNAKNTYGR